MKMIQQYLYAVTQYLPADSRDDVKAELEANIEDMLPENYSEADVRRVLEDLGNPKELSLQYHPNKRYLIGPGYYDQYITVMKLVVGIVAAVMGGIFIISWILGEPVAINDLDSTINTTVKFIVESLSFVIDGAIRAVLWVTVIFVILERSGVALSDKEVKGRAWSVDDLKEIPAPESAISRVGIVIGTIFPILFVSILWFRPELISIYSFNEEGVTLIPLLNMDRLRVYMPLVIAVTALTIAHLIWQFVAGRMTRPLAIANAVVNAFVIGASIIMLSDSSLFNNNFFQEFYDSSTAQGANPPIVTMDWLRGGLLILIILLVLWDTFDAFRKSRKA